MSFCTDRLTFCVVFVEFEKENVRFVAYVKIYALNVQVTLFAGVSVINFSSKFFPLPGANRPGKKPAAWVSIASPFRTSAKSLGQER